jgi:hypothetical protein
MMRGHRVYRYTAAMVAVTVLVLPAVVGATTDGSAELSGPVSPEERTDVLGADFRISDRTGTGGEWLGSVVWNGSAGQYLVVWGDDRDASTRGEDILGQRVSAGGSLLGGNFLISGPGATSNEGSPAVAWNGSDEYLVVWMDMRNQSTRGWDIYGQRVSATGWRLGGDFRISGDAATSDDWYPAVAWNASAGQYLVVWGDERMSSTRGADIFGQRVSAGGSLVGGDFRISGAGATGDELTPAVVWNGTANQYLVVWDDGRSTSTRSTDIFGQRVSATGSRLGGNFRISGAVATDAEVLPAVAWSQRSNQYLVVWEDQRSYSTRGWDIYGRRVSADGARIGGDFRVSGVGATADEKSPDIAWNRSANQYVVVWYDGRNWTTRSSDIYGGVVSATGSAVGGDFQICGPAATSYEVSPAVAWNGSANQGLVVWDDGRNQATRRSDIYGRRLSG